MKKIKKENAEILLYKIDNEGFDYALSEYSDWKKEFEGTKLWPAIQAYQDAKEKLEKRIFNLREEFELVDE